MKRLSFLCLALLLCLAVPAVAADKPADKQTRTEKQAHKDRLPPATAFERFSAVLPQGWSGEDQSGFSSGNNQEYMLSIGQLAQMQDHPGPVTEKDGFQCFTGEPRSKISSGEALTRVRATPDLMLIIVSQDPRNLGAEKVFQSLVPLTPDAKKLLERP